ncbi:MAG: diphosphomevalonate decarboxylase [Saprospiraceae bacterium]|nr:diphosphomevalonate decarboxylase [Saprospiraceae bacterium]
MNRVSWKSPSNIAIVKYWGKKGVQLPMNPSLSFTLNHCCTETSIEYKTGNGSIDFFYEGQQRQDFLPKIETFFKLIELPFFAELDLIIHSKNNFPHSAGIASSASSMSALSLCITEIEQKLYNKEFNFLQTASKRARMGSGSACRSVYPKAALWGNTLYVPHSSDQYAIDFSSELHNDFIELQDYIFLVSQQEKYVSSSAGHQLMNKHPYQYARIEQANNNIVQLMSSLKNGDWELFQKVCEEEALSLHALMMSSSPGYLLLDSDSIKIIKSIQQFRADSKTMISYTIDAGPNIHVVFPKNAKSSIDQWIQSDWNDYLLDNRIIRDQIGNGPLKMI